MKTGHLTEKQSGELKDDGGSVIKSAREKALERATTVPEGVPTTPPDATGSVGQEADELREKAAERDELVDQIQRLQAEFQNYRKRVLREREDLAVQANRLLIDKILVWVDHFKMALHSAKSPKDFDSLLAGLRVTDGEIGKTLAEAGVTVIEAAGKPFDPALHEAVFEEVDAALPDRTVKEELQKGYLLGGVVLRPVRVKVSRRPAQAEDGPAPSVGGVGKPSDGS
ncbi:MAG: nucleotide exchange factor GrpE [Planctomycetota bacterium]